MTRSHEPQLLEPGDLRWPTPRPPRRRTPDRANGRARARTLERRRASDRGEQRRPSTSPASNCSRRARPPRRPARSRPGASLHGPRRLPCAVATHSPAASGRPIAAAHPPTGRRSAARAGPAGWRRAAAGAIAPAACRAECTSTPPASTCNGPRIRYSMAPPSSSGRTAAARVRLELRWSAARPPAGRERRRSWWAHARNTHRHHPSRARSRLPVPLRDLRGGDGPLPGHGRPRQQDAVRSRGRLELDRLHDRRQRRRRVDPDDVGRPRLLRAPDRAVRPRAVPRRAPAERAVSASAR